MTSTPRPLPVPVPGTASVPLDDGAVVYNPSAGEIAVLNGVGAVVWAACCEGIDEATLLDELSAFSGRAADELLPEVRAYLAQLSADGLVAPVGAPAAAEPVDIWRRRPPDGGGPLRQRFDVLGEVVELQTASVDLHEAAAELCADLRTDAPATRWLAVEEVDGSVRSHGPRDGWRSHDDLDAFLVALPSELNVVVASWEGGLALHAAAARRADGALFAFPGESGAGKSTLVAALVRAGWDYLTDEATGLLPDGTVVGYPKPVSLDAASRRLVGLRDVGEGPAVDVPVGRIRGDVTPCTGPVGALDALVLPRRAAGAEPALVAVAAADRLATVAGFALNLRAAGAAGLRALVAAAAVVPCWELRYDRPEDALGLLAGLDPADPAAQIGAT